MPCPCLCWYFCEIILLLTHSPHFPFPCLPFLIAFLTFPIVHATPWTTWNSPGRSTREGSHSFLHRIFPTERSNPGLPHFRHILIFFILFIIIIFYFIILYWFAIHQHVSTTGVHVFPILNPPPTPLPIPSLWVIPMHQPQAFCILHRTWTGNSFLIWYYTCFNAILPNHPPPSLSHRIQKTILYLCVSFAVSHTGLLLPSF